MITFCLSSDNPLCPYDQEQVNYWNLQHISIRDDSDIGSPGVDGPPIMPKDPYAYITAAYEVPPSPDYIPGPEVPPSPDYIPGPEWSHTITTTYLGRRGQTEEQPLHAATSPTAESPGYILESDPEEDPEEDPADYPADRDDDDEEEEEHPAPGRLCPTCTPYDRQDIYPG
ncbi:hypothetical protein Tco_0547497 [Tanacetum coccineum]